MLNASPAPVNLQGWHLADQNHQTVPLPAGPLQPRNTLTIPAGNGFHLGNRGGTIPLLDPVGLKVHGVSYTARQAEREGQTITF